MKKIHHAILILIATICFTFSSTIMGAESQPSQTPTGWFRVDSDALGLQVWARATHKVGPLNLTSLQEPNVWAAGRIYGKRNQTLE
jgi:hypothetical protein